MKHTKIPGHAFDSPKGTRPPTTETKSLREKIKTPVNMLLTCALLSGCVAPTSPQARNTESKQVVETRSGNGAIATTISPKEYFGRLFSLPTKKSEFETQAEYDQRMSELLAQEEEVILEVDPSTITYKYDAENQVLLVVLEDGKFMDSLGLGLVASLPVFTVGRETTSSRDVTFRNGFGAVFEGTSAATNRYQIALPVSKMPLNSRWKLNERLSMYYVGMGAKNTPERAKKIVDEKLITLAFRGKVKDLKAIGKDYESITATPSMPQEIYVTKFVIPFAPSELLALDRTTKEIRVILPITIAQP